MRRTTILLLAVIAFGAAGSVYGQGYTNDNHITKRFMRDTVQDSATACYNEVVLGEGSTDYPGFAKYKKAYADSFFDKTWPKYSIFLAVLAGGLLGTGVVWFFTESDYVPKGLELVKVIFNDLKDKLDIKYVFAIFAFLYAAIFVIIVCWAGVVIDQCVHFNNMSVRLDKVTLLGKAHSSETRMRTRTRILMRILARTRTRTRTHM